jgi:hypothetical protein
MWWGRKILRDVPAPLLLFVFLLGVFALTSTGHGRTMDERMTLFQTRSLYLHGTTAMLELAGRDDWYGTLDRSGRPRAPYAPGHAVAATPAYAFGDAVLARLPGVPPGSADLMIQLAVTLTSAVFAAAAAALAMALFLKLGATERDALAAALAVAFGTPLFAYSGWFFSEPLACALLVAATLAVASGRPGVAGALLSATVLVRPTHVIAIPVFGAAVLMRDGLGAAVRLGAAAAIGPAIYLAHNWHVFGSPLEFGYPKAAEGGKRLNSFETPLWVGLVGFLVSPGKSLFLFSPPSIAAIAGLRHVAARDRALAVIAAGAPIVYVLFYATYTQWEGGYCFGPRYLVPALVLLSLAVGPAIAWGSPRLRRLAIGLAVAGCLVNAIGLATNFLEDQVRPERGYYDERFDYRLSHAPLVGQGALLVSGRPLDRWFLFVRTNGQVSAWTLAAIALALAAPAGVGAWGLRRRLAHVPVDRDGVAADA